MEISMHIFSPLKKCFFFDGIFPRKVDISTEDLKALREKLNVNNEIIDGPPRALSDKELQDIAVVKKCPPFSRIPLVKFNATKKIMSSYDCLPSGIMKPLVNKRVRDILEKLAPNDVQFFSAKVTCSDGELDGYQFLNVTNTIIGIDHEKSIYTRSKNTNIMGMIKYLTYKPGCMGEYKLARDKEFLPNLLVTPEVKAVFEYEKITGVEFVTPENFYSSLYIR